jgi:hypothetical protein
MRASGSKLPAQAAQRHRVHAKGRRDLDCIQSQRLRQLGGKQALASHIVAPVAAHRMATDLHCAVVADVDDFEVRQGLGPWNQRLWAGHGIGCHGTPNLATIISLTHPP